MISENREVTAGHVTFTDILCASFLWKREADRKLLNSDASDFEHTSGVMNDIKLMKSSLRHHST